VVVDVDEEDELQLLSARPSASTTPHESHLFTLTDGTDRRPPARSNT
jgi:hypothetical protein